MPVRTFTYVNDFELGLNGATIVTQTGSARGVADATGDGDQELNAFFDANPGVGDETRGSLLVDFGADVVGAEKIKDLSASFELEVVDGGPDGDGNFPDPDGFIFIVGPSDRSEGLAIQYTPLQDGVEITWNGVELSASGAGSLDFDAPGGGATISDVTLSVDDAGNVTTTIIVGGGPPITVSATIPNGEWDTADQDGWTVGLFGRTGNADGTGSVDDISISANIACFASGTRILIDTGQEVLIEDLRPGDRVRTLDNGYQSIRWIGRSAKDRVDLAANPKLRPIRIRAGALGGETPSRDLVVSRQHRILVKSAIAKRMFDRDEVLVPAIKLVGLDGVDIAEDVQDVEYFHLMFDQHQILWSDGALTESLYAGQQALAALGDDAYRELRAIFPEVLEPDFEYQPARLFVQRRKDINTLVARHQRNRTPLIADRAWNA